MGDVPRRGLLKAKPRPSGCGVRVGNACDPRHTFLGALHPFRSCSGTGPSCHIFFAILSYTQALSRCEPAEPPTPSGLLDGFLLSDRWLGDGGGGLDDGGDGSWQELVGFRSRATWW